MKADSNSCIRADLLEFCRQRFGEFDLELTEASCIEETFGIAELDTIIFYSDFVKHFSIAIPNNWDIRKHVSPVGFYDWRHYIRRWFSKAYREKTRYRDLTIGELDTMIETGLWCVEMPSPV